MWLKRHVSEQPVRRSPASNGLALQSSNQVVWGRGALGSGQPIENKLLIKDNVKQLSSWVVLGAFDTPSSERRENSFPVRSSPNRSPQTEIEGFLHRILKVDRTYERSGVYVGLLDQLFPPGHPLKTSWK